MTGPFIDIISPKPVLFPFLYQPWGKGSSPESRRWRRAGVAVGEAFTRDPRPLQTRVATHPELLAVWPLAGYLPSLNSGHPHCPIKSVP